MSYIAAADFRVGGLRPWTANLVLTEADGTNAYIDLVIGMVTSRVESDLNDDFEPPTPDNDETVDFDGPGSRRLYLPRRVRSITTVSTRAADGTLTAQASTLWRLHRSLNAAGTAMEGDGTEDYLEVIPTKNLSATGWGGWPFGIQTVQIVGKFGWAAVPDLIKRLVALRTYDAVKAKADPLSTIVQRTTNDAVLTFGPSVEDSAISDIFRRDLVAVG